MNALTENRVEHTNWKQSWLLWSSEKRVKISSCWLQMVDSALVFCLIYDFDFDFEDDYRRLVEFSILKSIKNRLIKLKWYYLRQKDKKRPYADFYMVIITNMLLHPDSVHKSGIKKAIISQKLHNFFQLFNSINRDASLLLSLFFSSFF